MDMDPHWKRLLIGLAVAFGVLVIGVCLGLPDTVIAAVVAGLAVVIEVRNKTAQAVIRLVGIFVVVGWFMLGLILTHARL